MVAAFTADYMKAVKSRSVAGGVGPRLLNRQSLNLRAARARGEGAFKQSSRRESKGSRNRLATCILHVKLEVFSICSNAHVMCFLKVTVKFCTMFSEVSQEVVDAVSPMQLCSCLTVTRDPLLAIYSQCSSPYSRPQGHSKLLQSGCMATVQEI